MSIPKTLLSANQSTVGEYKKKNVFWRRRKIINFVGKYSEDWLVFIGKKNMFWKGCNPFIIYMNINESLQPFINGRVNSERVATFQNIFFLHINTIQSSEYFLTNFLIFLLLKNIYFFVYFPAVDWFADSRVFGIYTLLIKIILPWEVIFQIKPRILEGNNFLKGTLWIQWTWFSS